MVDGGPQTGVVFNFDATHPEVVKIDPASGLLEAKAPGRAVSICILELIATNTFFFVVGNFRNK